MRMPMPLIEETEEKKTDKVLRRRTTIQLKCGDMTPSQHMIKALDTFTDQSNHSNQKIEDEVQLKDILIKAFMVVFTQKRSHHLLLNKDLVQIAFYCLHHTESISFEAKEKLSKLISIIFKFPQLQ